MRLGFICLFLAWVGLPLCGGSERKPNQDATTDPIAQLVGNTNWTSFVNSGREWKLADLPAIERELNTKARAARLALKAPFVKNPDDDIEVPRRDEFALYRSRLYQERQRAIYQQLLNQYDANRDGAITRGEIKPVLRDLHHLDGIPGRGDHWALLRHVLFLKYFDFDGNGFVDDVEDGIAGSFIAAARQSDRPDTESPPIGKLW